MLNNFLVCLEAVLPMFILLVIGAAVRRTGLLKEEEVRRLNKVVFIVCYPCMMFTNLYGADLEQAFDWKLIGFAAGFTFAVIGVATLLALWIEPNQRSRGAMIQAIYRSNFVIMGLPIAMNIYGHGNVAVTAMLIAVIVPIYNVMAVIILEVFRNRKPNPVEICRDVLKNPIILGGIAGLFCVLTGLTIPKFLEGVVDDLGVTAMTMSLIVLGASFDMSTLRHTGRNLVICVVSRLVIVPGIGLALAAAMGFRDVVFVTLLAMMAAPTAIASFTMAQSMDSDADLAGNCVIFSSVFACLTMFLWLFLYKTLGVF